jgi:magnesium transporter
MFRILSLLPSGETQEHMSLDKCREVLESADGYLWVDIFDASNEESTGILKGVFNFHPLAIADALEETHDPKIDDWHEYLSMVACVIDPPNSQETKVITRELDLFIGRNYLVTYHAQQSQTIERVREVVRSDNQVFQRGPIYILYLLLDETADDFIANTEYLEETLNDIEDQLFDNPDSSILEDIFALKRSVLHLRQNISPLREVLNKLARGNYEVLEHQPSMYFQDVYDHFLRLHEITENLLELTGSTLEIYLSVVNNRMNSVMKTLTIITTLFMPISFLAGFFGMNFFKPGAGFESWTSQPVFWIVLLASVLFPAFMLIYIYRKGWMK